MGGPTRELRAIQGGRRRAPAVSIKAQDQAVAGFAEYFEPATDSHGHSVHLGVKIHPNRINEIDSLLATKLFPWKTRAEAIRWLLARGLDLAVARAGDERASTVRRAANAAAIGAGHTEAMIEFNKDVRNYRRAIDGLVKDGMRNEARRLLRSILAQIDGMDIPEWQTRYRDAMLKPYGWLLQGMR